MDCWIFLPAINATVFRCCTLSLFFLELVITNPIFIFLQCDKKAEPLQSLLNPLVGSQDPIIDAFLSITKVDIHQISSHPLTASSQQSSAPTTATSCTDLSVNIFDHKNLLNDKKHEVDFVISRKIHSVVIKLVARSVATRYFQYLTFLFTFQF